MNTRARGHRVEHRRVNPFELPRGILGTMAGHLMAAVNTDINRTVVDILALLGQERVLEVGFGPGVGIQLLAARLPDGHILGIDASPVMLRQATRRNWARIEEGLVELRLGSVLDLPWEDRHVDAISSVNSVQVWQPLGRAMAELHRVLRPGGRIAIGVHRWAERGLGIEQVRGAMSEAGFGDLAISEGSARIGTTACFVARR